MAFLDTRMRRMAQFSYVPSPDPTPATAAPTSSLPEPSPLVSADAAPSLSTSPAADAATARAPTPPSSAGADPFATLPTFDVGVGAGTGLVPPPLPALMPSQPETLVAIASTEALTSLVVQAETLALDPLALDPLALDPLALDPMSYAAQLPHGALGNVDAAAADLLRPLLREWLSENMPRIVEKALRIEVAKGIVASPTSTKE